MLLFLPLSPSFTLSGTKMARWDFSSLRMWRVQLLGACNLHFSVSRHRKVHLRLDPDFRVKSNPDAFADPCTDQIPGQTDNISADIIIVDIRARGAGESPCIGICMRASRFPPRVRVY